MKINCLPFFLVLLFLFSACDKDQLNPTTTNQHMGDLTFTVFHHIINDTLIKPIDTSAAAIFWGPDENTATVYWVKINDAWMAYHSLLGHYLQHDLTNITDFSRLTWDISDSEKSPIPSAHYINTQGMPVYTGYKLLPNSVDRTKDISFKFYGLSNAQNIFLELNDNNGNHIEKTFTGVMNSGVITIPSSELSILNAVSNGYVAFNISNVCSQYLGKSFFTYTNNISYLKQLRIQ